MCSRALTVQPVRVVSALHRTSICSPSLVHCWPTVPFCSGGAATTGGGRPAKAVVKRFENRQRTATDERMSLALYCLYVCVLPWFTPFPAVDTPSTEEISPLSLAPPPVGLPCDRKWPGVIPLSTRPFRGLPTWLDRG